MATTVAIWLRSIAACFGLVLPQVVGIALPANAPDSSVTKNGEGSFVVLGDWGNPFNPGKNDANKDCWGPHWRCNGCGFARDAAWCDVGSPGYEEDEYSQTTVASAMAGWAKANQAQFVINVGDNFYPRGVTSVTDPLWDEVFEGRYSDLALQIPWFSVLGNHDYGGFQCFFDSEKMQFRHAQAQIDYDTEPDWEWPQPKNTRWVMPNLWFKKRVVFGNATIDLFMIDTNYNDGHDGPLACGTGEIRMPPACVGADWTNCKSTCEKIGREQAAWLQAELPKSNATWKFLVGHHPLSYFMGSEKGLTVEFLRVNNVSAYFCGHVHGMSQAWYKPNSDGNGFVRTTGSQPVPGAIFEMQNGAGGGSYPDGSFEGYRWGFSAGIVKSTHLEIFFASDKNTTREVVIPPPCVQNWPGSASCAWRVDIWETCTSGVQSRGVWCMGGAEENCPKDAKPESSRTCGTPPAPAPKPPPTASPSPIVEVVLVVVVVGIIAVGSSVGCMMRKRRSVRSLIAAGRQEGPLDISLQPSAAQNQDMSRGREAVRSGPFLEAIQSFGDATA